MKGSIRQRSKGSWQIILDTGTGPDGKRRRHFETPGSSMKRPSTCTAPGSPALRWARPCGSLRIRLVAWRGYALSLTFFRCSCTLSLPRVRISLPLCKRLTGSVRRILGLLAQGSGCCFRVYSLKWVNWLFTTPGPWAIF